MDNYRKIQYRWYMKLVISCTTGIVLDSYYVSKLSQNRAKPFGIDAGEAVFRFDLRIALKDA